MALAHPIVRSDLEHRLAQHVERVARIGGDDVYGVGQIIDVIGEENLDPDEVDFWHVVAQRLKHGRLGVDEGIPLMAVEWPGVIPLMAFSCQGGFTDAGQVLSGDQQVLDFLLSAVKRADVNVIHDTTGRGDLGVGDFGDVTGGEAEREQDLDGFCYLELLWSHRDCSHVVTVLEPSTVEGDHDRDSLPWLLTNMKHYHNCIYLSILKKCHPSRASV
jgi:hypothetical protein